MATRANAFKLIALCLTAVTAEAAASSFSPPPESTPTPKSLDDLERKLVSALQYPLNSANVSAVTQVLAATIAASKFFRPRSSGRMPCNFPHQRFSAVKLIDVASSLIGHIVVAILACTFLEMSINDKLIDSIQQQLQFA